jgi:putative membrane protein
MRPLRRSSQSCGSCEAAASRASSAPSSRCRSGVGSLRRNGLVLGECLRAGQVDAPLAAEIDAHLSGLAAAAAGCERIQSLPIPFAYTLLLHRTAYLYCFLLPFGLVDLIGPVTPFVVAIVAYTFFGLDAVGDEIEDPFGEKPHHLPLEAICTTIEINVLEAIGAAELPITPQPIDGLLR